MVDDVALRPYLDGANVDVAVLALRPDYRALLPAVDEDLPKYRGAPRLMGGQRNRTVRHRGRRCQARHTQVGPNTTAALFILDALAPDDR